MSDSAREAAVERVWYALGLALVEEGFTPPAYIDAELRGRLKRVAGRVVDVQRSAEPAWSASAFGNIAGRPVNDP